MYEEAPEYSYAAWYADTHPIHSEGITADKVTRVDRRIDDILVCGDTSLTTMEKIRFRGDVQQAASDLFDVNSRRQRSGLNTVRPAISSILALLDRVEKEMNGCSQLLVEQPFKTRSFESMAINNEVPWSREEVSKHPLLPFAVALREAKHFFNGQCPPPNPSRGGRSDIDAEVRCYVAITKAFEAVNLPLVIKMREHDGGSKFLRDDLCLAVEHIVIGYSPASAGYRARRARELGLL